MLEFQLFRVKTFLSAQGLLYINKPTSAELLRIVVESRPTEELRQGITWHIGNVENVNDTGIYFRFGKTTKATFETFKDGVFVDQEFELSPYTHVLLDVELGVMAIAKKARLAPKIIGIAGRLSRLLNLSVPLREQGANIEIVELQDPESFIAHLRHAHSILRFTMSFSRPNPFDANRDFVQPLQKCLTESNGDKGKVEMKGESLSSSLLEELTRSAAATGDDASARLRTDPQVRAVTRYLKGKAVMIGEEDVGDMVKKKELIQRIRKIYKRVRG